MDIQKISKLYGAEFIKEIYKEILNREPDEDGLKGYLDALNNGLTRAEILLNINSSEEARTKNGISDRILLEKIKSTGMYEEYEKEKNISFKLRIKRKIKRMLLHYISEEYEELSNFNLYPKNSPSADLYNITSEKEQLRKEMPDSVYKIYLQLRGEYFQK